MTFLKSWVFEREREALCPNVVCHLYHLSLCGLNKIFWKIRQAAFECAD